MVSSATPLLRNVPEDKPMLCNTWGLRHRLWGSLENCSPNHFQPEHLNNLTNVKGRNNLEVKGQPASYVPDSDNGGKIPTLWNSRIPTKKRTRRVYKKMTPMKKFQKQLLNEWINHGKLNESSPEEVLLLYNVNNFIPRNEIGLGGILLKPDGTST